MNSPSLRITETFLSLQGEGPSTGYPTFFIRLTGCPLRCVYCDTDYAFQGGDNVQIDQLVRQAQESGVKRVCVTGGEPLAQPDCLHLLSALCDAGFIVSLETSGALLVDQVDPRVSKVLDFKTPDSAEEARNLWQNIEHIGLADQVKFVISGRRDFEWARDKVIQYGLSEKVGEVLFSPVVDTLAAHELADWVVSEALPVRFQLQLHKVLWGDRQGV